MRDQHKPSWRAALKAQLMQFIGNIRFDPIPGETTLVISYSWQQRTLVVLTAGTF